MQVSELKELLYRGAEAVEVSSSEALRIVGRRAGRRRWRRRITATIAAVTATGVVSVVAVAASHDGGADQKVAVNAGTPGPSTNGLAALSPAMREMVRSYARGGAFISNVSDVAIKQTTWGDYVAWSASALGSAPASPEVGDPPEPAYTDATKIYLVVQVGKVSCASMYGCHGRVYNWDLNVVSFAAPEKGSGIIITVPDRAVPSSFSGLPGPEVDFNTRSGMVTTHLPAG